MGAPIGSIFELSLRSTVCDQRCINVLHYVVATETSETSIVAESLQLATAADAVGALGPAFRACLAQNCTHDEVVAQCIKDTLGTRYARQVLDVGDPGDAVEDATTANVSAVITKRTSFSGRWAVGGFHMPGIGAGFYTGGLVTDVGFKAALNALASEMLQPITTVLGGEYLPVIYHPDGLHGGYTPLLETELQDELRTMRRRTVGRGI